ncbi:hypothetical protein D9615_008889 [Tricholomella constricta]|uniref:Uncharacterized protein n=1 Tax=Tricholomella constricta TaxID=117010 RepID=A0A8H5GZK1_9AGAR|nr:hypothetical protein D9615_008889 [Tricholomella constricta]
MFNLLLTSTLLFYIFLSSNMGSVDALHLPRPPIPRDVYNGLSKRDVYNPRITNPATDTAWAPGSKVTVTWDLHDMPEKISQEKSKVILGWIEPGSMNEHLDLEHPLAEGFSIRQGHASFIVPKVPPRNNYIVVVFGDSGNRSPTFRIGV